jgi:hypothetical protein
MPLSAPVSMIEYLKLDTSLSGDRVGPDLIGAYPLLQRASEPSP